MFEIGIIVKPQGIRGEVRVLPTTDDPTRFELLDEVFLRQAKAPANAPLQKYTITDARLQKGVVILTLKEITDRNAAEKLVGTTLVIPDEWALPCDTDEYYVRDLIGCAAVDESGFPLGTIAEVFSTGANDVYVILPPADAQDTVAFMVPAIKDVVRNVNLTEKCVTLRLLEGMRELRTTVRPS
ncbi:MAG: ribosome maturation factor RimM [Defluviitaleaceae bacterium]|nr:ribosome maturation factor RimM [Defluviitaleaceae bacterium]